MMKKDKEKGHHKKSSKCKRAYVDWESDSNSSSDESLISSVELAKLCFMTNKKNKKNVSHSNLEYTNELSYSQLQKAFEIIYFIES